MTKTPAKTPRNSSLIKSACLKLEKALDDFEKVISKENSPESQQYKRELKNKMQEIQKKLDYLS